MLVDFKETATPDISVANNERLKVVVVGTAYLNFDGGEIAVKNVLCVPVLNANLLSVSEIIKID